MPCLTDHTLNFVQGRNTGSCGSRCWRDFNSVKGRINLLMLPMRSEDSLAEGCTGRDTP